MTSVKPGEVAYYLDEFADECLPEGLDDVTLEGWAKWLTGPDSPFDLGVQDGQEFAGSTLTFLPDVTVRRVPKPDDMTDEEENEFEELEFSPALPNRSTWDFAAVRFGPGLGWDSDSILDPGDLEDGLCNICCPLLEPGEDALLAIGKCEMVRLRYRADPSRLEVVQ